MYKNYIFLSVSLLCINSQAMQQDLQSKNAEKQAELLFLTLHPQEIAGEARFLTTYDTHNARLAAKLIHDGIKVDYLPLLKKIEQNKDALPNTYEVIMAGKVVQNWNPPIRACADGSKYSYVELAAISFEECSKLGDDAGAILKYNSKFVDAIVKLRVFGSKL